jgi:hypothetical protein
MRRAADSFSSSLSQNNSAADTMKLSVPAMAVFDSTKPRSYTDVLFGGIRTPWAFSISVSKKTS